MFFKMFYLFTRAFGKNFQGQTSDIIFAASRLTTVLHRLNEVMDYIKVFHEFWFEEATNMATEVDIQLKLPGSFPGLPQSPER